MCEAIFLTCDYGSRLIGRTWSPHRTKTLFNTKIPGGPPAVFQLSKYASGDLRLILGNERYLTVLDVEDLLSNPPLPGGLLGRDGVLSSSCKPLYHRAADRTSSVGALLAGEFGETSNVIVTASEIEGVTVRDLRIRNMDESFPGGGGVDQNSELKFSITRKLGLPPRSLRSACFSPNFEEIIILTESQLFTVDRRFAQQPRHVLKLPLASHDSAHKLTIAKGRCDGFRPGWISTRKGGLILLDYSTTQLEYMTHTAVNPTDRTGALYTLRPEDDATSESRFFDHMSLPS
eukprot:Protomagalhaensia_sp_Gyna_25__1548@NODE_1798_length_1532_cov_11_947086_g1475_i0_p1_GENE_NODE_1798_length_1532_cov_11_947086_g1475_i0NODE_1798_length_1532_cov_11_947086_g1475_i0_p1_ORF_typecomplete_len290_score24_56_NODE_1798_length_1532_cov_11_947086_g1475_i06241493